MLRSSLPGLALSAAVVAIAIAVFALIESPDNGTDSVDRGGAPINTSLPAGAPTSSGITDRGGNHARGGNGTAAAVLAGSLGFVPVAFDGGTPLTGGESGAGVGSGGGSGGGNPGQTLGRGTSGPIGSGRDSSGVIPSAMPIIVADPAVSPSEGKPKPHPEGKAGVGHLIKSPGSKASHGKGKAKGHAKQPSHVSRGKAKGHATASAPPAPAAPAPAPVAPKSHGNGKAKGHARKATSTPAPAPKPAPAAPAPKPAPAPRPAPAPKKAPKPKAAPPAPAAQPAAPPAAAPSPAPSNGCGPAGNGNGNANGRCK